MSQSLNSTNLELPQYNIIDFENRFNTYLNEWKSLEPEYGQQRKLVVGSTILLQNNLTTINMETSVPSTIFGEISENLSWRFTIEGNSDLKKLANHIEEQTKYINSLSKDNEHELVTKYKINHLIDRKNEIYNSFKQIYSQLNPKLEQSVNDAILLTSLAFLELEQLSIDRNSYYMLHNNMYSLSNFLDTWIACMDVQIKYIKPLYIEFHNKLH